MKWGTGLERYFALLKILEIGSFTKAAEAMGYSQSAVSQMVQSLESELSLKLLYRSRNGIKLTPEGEALLPYIQRTVNHYNAMLEKTRELKGLNGGLIRIGTLSSVSSQWLPGLIKDFQTLYPKVHFLLHQGDYTTIPAWVRAGEIDFGFVNPDAESVRGLHTIFVTSGGHKAILWPRSRGSPWSSWPRRPSCCWRRGASASRWRPSAPWDWSHGWSCGCTTTFPSAPWWRPMWESASCPSWPSER